MWAFYIHHNLLHHNNGTLEELGPLMGWGAKMGSKVLEVQKGIIGSGSNVQDDAFSNNKTPAAENEGEMVIGLLILHLK